MKILVFGGTGMLGHKLVQTLGQRFEVWTTVRKAFNEIEAYGIFRQERTFTEIDVLSDLSVVEPIRAVLPDVVVNAVGTIKQVPHAKDEITTLGTNTLFPLKLASLSVQHNFRLISISTDCVFSGLKGNYRETDKPDARDLYGLSKLLGEVSAGGCLTLRTSMVGRELEGQNSLVEWFLGNRGRLVDGWANAIYSGFSTLELARIIGDIIDHHPGLRGLYHVSSRPISKYALLSLLNDAYRAQVEISRSEEVTIDRSLDSTRFREATGYEPPSWPDMVSTMADDPTPYDTFHA